MAQQDQEHRGRVGRREFLQRVGGSLLVAGLSPAHGQRPPPETRPAHAGGPAARHVMTVNGPVGPDQFGTTLAHEHVLVDFVGAAGITPDRYDSEVVLAKVRPHVEEVAALGVRSIVECTPMFLGRDPALLQRLSRATGVSFVTNTGLYGARAGMFLPGYAAAESAARLARRWIQESRTGIEDTGVRPGLLKCGVNPAPVLSEMDRKLVEAAALTHLETGLAIAVHTGPGPGREQIAILRDHGVPARAFIWTHAQNARDDDLLAAAGEGAWISLDGIQRQSLARHVAACSLLKERGHLRQVLVSHDAGWYDPAKPEGGPFRPYTELFATFLPALRERGFTDADIRQLLERNPFEAFALPG
jgi:phosphotriesterase-related protein